MNCSQLFFICAGVWRSRGPSGRGRGMSSRLVPWRKALGLQTGSERPSCPPVYILELLQMKAAGASIQLVQTSRQTGLPRRRAPAPKQWLELCHRCTHQRAPLELFAFVQEVILQSTTANVGSEKEKLLNAPERRDSALKHAACSFFPFSFLIMCLLTFVGGSFPKGNAVK